MRTFLLASIAAVTPLAAASAPVLAQGETIDATLARAEAEARQAERRVTALEAQAIRASDEASRLAAERQKAAAEIGLAEARLATADLEYRRARADLALREQRLARRRAPLAALLAGLASIGRRPPILALADGTSVSEAVRIRALVDSTMPQVIRRSAALRAELDAGRKLADAAAAARDRIGQRGEQLAKMQQHFARLETQALGKADTVRRTAFGAQDRVLAGDEQLLDLRSEAEAAAAARRMARQIAAMPLAPARPFAPDRPPERPGIAYRLPTTAPVVEGLGTISAAGVRSRGIRFATRRGAALTAPASGTILFAGAFRQYDGIVIIDHGRDWISVLTNVAPSIRRGARVAAGEPLGRALSEVSVELRHRGVPQSAALIAGSSVSLSNRAETR